MPDFSTTRISFEHSIFLNFPLHPNSSLGSFFISPTIVIPPKFSLETFIYRGSEQQFMFNSINLSDLLLQHKLRRRRRGLVPLSFRFFARR